MRFTKTVETEVEVELDGDDLREALSEMDAEELAEIIDANLNSKQSMQMMVGTARTITDQDLLTGLREIINDVLDCKESVRSVLEYAMDRLQRIKETEEEEVAA